jgi:hypothetical protein
MGTVFWCYWCSGFGWAVLVIIGMRTPVEPILCNNAWLTSAAWRAGTPGTDRNVSTLMQRVIANRAPGGVCDCFTPQNALQATASSVNRLAIRGMEPATFWAIRIIIAVGITALCSSFSASAH